LGGVAAFVVRVQVCAAPVGVISPGPAYGAFVAVGLASEADGVRGDVGAVDEAAVEGSSEAEDGDFGLWSCVCYSVDVEERGSGEEALQM